MKKRYWYRSLYWRIAIGFVLALAAMLVVQAMLFVWVLSRSGPRLPGEPERFAQTLAVDLGRALQGESTLDLARLEGGGGALVVEEVPVEELFARVAARHERECREAGIAITAAVEPGADTITGDRGRLEQALQNLAANALRAAPSGTAIELRAHPVGGRIAVTVTDRGPGIAPEHLPHIFDRFYKVEPARTPSGGSGLGLSIVKAIVERHGGTITATSQPGRTTFQILLPTALWARAGAGP